MSFDESAIGGELSPVIGRPLWRLDCVSGIHDRGSLGMREKKNLLSANPERIFESSHQRQRRFALTALELCDVTGLHSELFCQRALRQPEFQAFSVLSAARDHSFDSYAVFGEQRAPQFCKMNQCGQVLKFFGRGQRLTEVEAVAKLKMFEDRV
jgi:hypothetical protein